MRTGRGPFSFACVLLAALVLTGCPAKKDAGADAASDAAIAAIDAGAVNKVANEADIKRYPADETALDGDETVKAPSMDARKSVPKGDVVASLKSGTTVSQIAEHNGWYLVSFDDPKDASRKLEGWTPKLALQTLKAHKPAAAVPRCKDTEMLSINMADGIAKCRAHCADDSDCQKGEGCEGLQAADEKGARVPYKGAMVCDALPSAATKDAGAPLAAWGLPSPTPTTISIPNPKHLPCPAGFKDSGGFATCQRTCDDARPCPKGLCQAAGWCE